MFTHPFAVVMALTFFAAIITMLVGVTKVGDGNADRTQSTKLMALRVGLCFVLLVEILIYVTYFKS